MRVMQVFELRRGEFCLEKYLICEYMRVYASIYEYCEFCEYSNISITISIFDHAYAPNVLVIYQNYKFLNVRLFRLLNVGRFDVPINRKLKN